MKKSLLIVLISTIGVLLILWVIGLKYPTHIYSPGDLNRAHYDIKQCKQCHIPFKGAVSKSCKSDECHSLEKLTHLSEKPLSDLHRNYGKRDCMNCHTEHKGFSGKITKAFDHSIFAANLINECASCHIADYQKHHPGKYSTECRECHVSTTNWEIVSFDHDEYFPLTGDHFASCDTCHSDSNYKEYTCLNCHVHSTSHIRHEHEEHGIYNYGDCLRCHRMNIEGKSYGKQGAEYFEHEEEEEYEPDEYDDD